MAEILPGTPVSEKVSQLNQLVQGRKVPLVSGGGNGEGRSLATRDGLLDAVLALYEECSHESLMKNQYVKDFVWKHKNTVDHLKKLRISISDFAVKNVIGRGHFGEVQVVREKSTSDVYALKVLRKADTLAQQTVAFYEEERDIMAKACSPWLTQLQYAFQDNTHLYLVMEFHPGGDLLSLLGRYDDTFEEQMARFYLAEMVLALHALHSMGYVHRDVKPENVLIDRTGHIKLVDFGSACKLNDTTASVSNMPVGTPDYICPEVLVRMNDTKNPSMFGCECDWWSLGVCGYEMLFGKTPFTSDDGSMVTTYANIMKYKETLSFPTDLSKPAESFIRSLLTGSKQRLKYEQICVHPFFAQLDFDNIRQTRPPFIPTVTSNDDTSNFEEFEKTKPQPYLNDPSASTGFTGRDLPFIGFTFTKSFNTDRLPSVADHMSSPACKNSLERRLAAKSQELQDLREKCKGLEDRDSHLKADTARVEASLLKKEQNLHSLELERDAADKNLVHYIAEVNSLKRQLEMEKQQRTSDESKVVQMLNEINGGMDRTIRIKTEQLQLKIEELEKLTCELRCECDEKSAQCVSLKKQVKQEQQLRKQTEAAREKMNAGLRKLKDQLKCQSEGKDSEIEELQQRLEETEAHCTLKVNKALEQNQEVTSMFESLRETKNCLEKELLTLQMERDGESHIRKRLFDSEIKCRNLESEAGKIVYLEKKEAQLKQHLEEKSTQLRDTITTLQDLEERLENREIEYKKCERIYAQREDQHLEKIQDLEQQLCELRSVKCDLEESSILVCEDNEEKLRKIHIQEETILNLKQNMELLEDQLAALKDDVERTPTHKYRKSRRSGVCQTESPLRSPHSKKARQYEEGVQTETMHRMSGSCQTEDHEVDVCSTQTSFRRSRSRTRSRSPHKVSFQVQTEPVDRYSGCCQTEPSEVEELSTQTSFITERRSPKKVSFTASLDLKSTEVQTTPGVNDHRRSNLTHTSPIKASRKSNQVQTDLVLPTDKHVFLKNQAQGSITVEVKVRATKEEQGQGDLALEDSLSSQSATEESLNNVSMSSMSSADAKRLQPEKDEVNTKKLKKVKVSSRTWWPRKDTETIQTAGLEGEQNEKEFRRKQAEMVSDLRQEKIYLEYKVDTLEGELKEIKDGTHQQRIRALDLKHDLKERTSHFEKKMDDLKDELSQLKVKSSEANINMKSAQEKEEAMRVRLEKAQAELDRLKLESRQSSTKLKEEKESFESQVKFLTSKCEKLEGNTTLLTKCVEETEEDLKILTQKYIEVVPRNRELEEALKKHQEEKTQLKLEVDHVTCELTVKQRKADLLEQQYQKLQSLCKELESQLSDFEHLNSNYEQKENKWSSDKFHLQKSVDEQQEEVTKLRRDFERERDLRQKLESKREELSELLQTSTASYKAELGQLRSLSSEQDTRVEILNHQLTQMEKERTLVEVDCKNIKRRMGYLDEENTKLKEEISAVITKLSEVKNSNLKLSKNLEDAMDKYEMLSNQNADLISRIDSLNSSHSQDKFKMEATLSQQAKLIDYLQAKVENPPKKKKGLFTPRSDSQLTPGIQLRELQHSLTHEREKNMALKQEILRLKDELHQARTEGTTVKTSRIRSIFSDSGESLLDDYTPTSSTPYHNNCAATLTALTLTATGSSTPSSHSNQGLMSVPKTPKSNRKNKDQKKWQGVAHRFSTGLNTKATKCGLCLGAVHFVKLASKCEVCRIVCHPKCISLMPPTCGAPIEYVRLFGETLQLAKTTNTMRLPITRLNIHLSTWVKVPKSSKHAWEKRYMLLKDNRILFYSRETTATEGAPPMQEIDLCPNETQEVTVHSGVTAAELNNTSSTDLPYIMRLEIDPKASSGPGRSHYLMFLNFTDKQKWAAILEAIVNHSDKNASPTSDKVLGNLILSLSNRRVEINCTLILAEQELLVGTDEGLYLLETGQTLDSRQFLNIQGVDAVSVLHSEPELDLILLLTGKERRLQMIHISTLQRNIHQNPLAIELQRVEDIVTATVFDCHQKSDGLYVCVATAEDTKVTVLKYSSARRKFSTLKVVEMSEACSCMYFGENGVILGADKFYIMDPQTYALRDFLDDSDTSLAFAAFGASQYESFPVAVLMVAPPGEPEEFLLCFNLFGVFVDNRGRRTRQGNLKWRGLPLNFGYRSPYLYIIQYNVIQVTQILPRHTHRLQGERAMINLPCPRYLGPAPLPGAVHIAAIQEGATEILRYRGNMATELSELDDGEKENEFPVYATPKKAKHRRKQPEPDCWSSGSEDVSPPAKPPRTISPTAIADLSTSPRRRRKNSETSITSDSSAFSMESLRHNFEGKRQPQKQCESYQKQPYVSATSSASASNDEGCHATIKTLKEVLAEQSRQRRGFCKETKNFNN